MEAIQRISSAADEKAGQEKTCNIKKERIMGIERNE